MRRLRDVLRSFVPVLLGFGVYIARKYEFDPTHSPLEPYPWVNLPPLASKPYPNSSVNGYGGMCDGIREHEGIMIGPESLAVYNTTSSDGLSTRAALTGTGDGLVWFYDDYNNRVFPIFHSGTFMLENRTGFGDPKTNLAVKCNELAKKDLLRHSKDMEELCGRPLGLHVDEERNIVYILDAYFGLFKLQLSNDGQSVKNATHVYDSQEIDVQQPAGIGGVPTPPRFLNDITISPSGKTAFITDSSWKNRRQENRAEIFDAAPRGRLLRLRLNDDDHPSVVETVMCGLHFPNGVEIDMKGESLLIVESTRLRILNIPLRELEERKQEVCSNEPRNLSSLPRGARLWSDYPLPGFPDNIVKDEFRGGYWVGLGILISEPFSLLHSVLSLPLWVRRVAGYLLPTKFILGFSGKKTGLVLELNEDGAIVSSLLDETGHIALISEARPFGNEFLLLGSSQNPYLGRVRIPVVE